MEIKKHTTTIKNFIRRTFNSGFIDIRPQQELLIRGIEVYY